jgi:beta-glucosidase-like glycosyl hydrolase/serine/threonine protein kinase
VDAVEQVHTLPVREQTRPPPATRQLPIPLQPCATVSTDARTDRRLAHRARRSWEGSAWSSGGGTGKGRCYEAARSQYPPMPLTGGARFAGLTIERLLGAGPTGEVYLVEHPSLPRPHALKILAPDICADAAFRERFTSEADLAASLVHRHVVRVYERGDRKARLWILMDYVNGSDVGRLLQERHANGMPMRNVLPVVTAVARALDYAHQRGLLHRDVKPSNILLTEPHDGRRQIFLTDFGIEPGVDHLGGFAAPEQLAGETLDGRADQYALAATASFLLTGSAPSQHPDSTAAIGRELAAAPIRVATMPPELRSVDSALSRALSTNPDERFATCVDFADALAGRAGNEETAAKPTPPRENTSRSEGPAFYPLPTRARSQRRPSRTVIVAVSVVAAVLLGLGVFGGVQLGHSRHTVAPSAARTTQSAGPASVPVSSSAAAAAVPGCGDVNAVVASMSTRDKLAQLLMVGVTGAADARAVVATQHVGGIFIGSWTDLSMLNDGVLDAIAGSGPLPLAVSVDEEGGRVSRLSSLIGASPSPRVLAQTQTPEQVYQLALDRGRKMRTLGITIDFAPVVDVTDAPADTVIGDRSFSDQPAVVAQFAGAYARGLRDAGVLPVLKHFPGHGRASGDSHAGAVVTPPLDDLQNADLVPYRTLVGQGPVGVMIGHLQVPGLTGSDPASLSRTAVELLRNGTGYGGPPFNGPVFTDDLSSMKAISDRYGVADAVLRALQAGADTALWVTTTEVPVVLDRLQAAVAGGELSMTSVDASVLRMATAKALNSHCSR